MISNKILIIATLVLWFFILINMQVTGGHHFRINEIERSIESFKESVVIDQERLSEDFYKKLKRHTDRPHTFAGNPRD